MIALMAIAGADVFKRLLIDARGVPPGEVHNDILAIAVDGGLPAVFAFLAMVMSFVLITVRAANESRRQGNLRKKQLLVAALAAILCLLIDGMSSFPLRLATSAMLFWGVLAIGARLAQESGQPEPTLQTDETTEDGAGTGT